MLVITSLCTATLAQCVALIIPFKYLHSEILVEPGVSILRLGCIVPPPQNIWPIFVSPVILHTVLYLFTAYRAVMSDSITSETLPLMNRLLREYVADQWQYSRSLTSMISVVGYYTSQYSVCHEINSLCVLFNIFGSISLRGFLYNRRCNDTGSFGSFYHLVP